MTLSPTALTLDLRNGHLRITPLMGEEFLRRGWNSAVWEDRNSRSAQFLATMPTTRPSTGVQRAAPGAGKVHGPTKEVGQSGTDTQDEKQQGNLKKRSAHSSSTSTPGDSLGS
jgi:hypothetical protein